MEPAWTLFLDRDGVINRRKIDGYITNWSEFIFEEGALSLLSEVNSIFQTIVIITNQQGVGKGLMTQDDLNDIHALSKKVEEALIASNFNELASLSSKLEKLVQSITDNFDYRKNIQKAELDTLEDLLIKVKKYQVDTEMKFKDYTLRISKQTKMQNAYKQNQG